MSLLLDALHRASKDKEKAALAAAHAAAAESKSEGKVVLTEPGAVAIDFPDLVPAASFVEEPVVQAPLALAPEVSVTPDPAPVSVVAAKPIELALEIELDESAALMQPQVPTTEKFAAKSPSLAVDASAAAVRTGDTVLGRPTDTTWAKPAHPQAAAAAIQSAYAAPLFASKPPPNRRALVLAGIAGTLGLAFASLMLGVWGDPEKLLGLAGSSSIAPLTPAPMAAPPAQESASAAVQAAQTEVPAPVTVATPASAPIAAMGTHAAGAATVALALAPRGAASAPLGVPSGTLHQKARTPPDEVVLRASGVAPVFAARMRTQSVLEQAYTALLAGRLDDASRTYAAALEASPGEPDALLGLAYIAHTKGQRDEAQNYYRKVLRQDPSNSIANAGLAALESGANGAPNSERAKELAARQPDSAAVQALAAAALVQEGALPDAALAFARAQALEPENPLHAYNLGVAHDKLGNYAQAIVQYDKALRVNASAPTPMAAHQVQAARARATQLRQSLGRAPEAKP
ncbi:MAG: hypothetical protein CFE44_05140 [Burkholderiales bacterium PBB4]|nr:MAG: hypothetical protein CFE44_05140 [Burkholderiales bacterium PBB4]